MMVPYICLIVLCLSGFYRHDAVVAALGDGPAAHRSRQSSSLHWPAMVGAADDRSRRTVASVGGRLERSLFASSGGSGAVCSEQSEISENTIIRTKDSRALGARFLNETSLGPDARDRCFNLCCSFHACNVAVYEEKDGGNCYLFDCGPPEDFRCKFTSHSHYTSGVIRRRENAHEEELTQLKKISITAVTPAQPSATELITNPPTSTTVKPKRSCSRYQFECHTTGECIAIYNACDGIIQCSDGSDEAPELGCPATTTESTTMKTPAPTLPLIVNKSPVDVAPSSVINQHPSFEWSRVEPRSRNRDRYEPAPGLDIPVKPEPRPEASHWRTLPESPRSYPAERVHQSYQASAGEALPYPADQDRSLSYYGAENSRRYGSSWREQDRGLGSSEYRVNDNVYGDHYYDKEPRIPYEVNSNSYPSNRKHEWERNKPVVMNNSPNPSSIESRPVPPASHVQDNIRFNDESATSGDKRVPIYAAAPIAAEASVTERTTVTSTQPTSTQATTLAKTKPPALVTKHEVAANHAHIHHFNVNQADFQEARAERSRQTVGAAWALTLGLSVTAVLVLLVGCRLRSLKRHLRRGRGGHARDADYLVNGMYL